MPPPEVIALADEVRAHLNGGALAGLGPIALVHAGGILPDAELAARIVLADVAHCSASGADVAHCSALGQEASARCWAQLAAQLRCLKRAIHRPRV
jgi:hypothetical protein